MKKQFNFQKVWEIISPIVFYYSITLLTLLALDYLLLALPVNEGTTLFRQFLSSLAAFVFLWPMYRQDKSEKKRIAIQTVFFSCIIGGCFAIAWNTILGFTGIAEYSRGYNQVAKTFYTGRLFLEIAALCIVIPIVEELLYRGIVYVRIRRWLGVRAAILLSAVIFGLVHMNLVQFIYASVFGLLLAYITEKTGSFYGAAIAHMVANLTSVLRAETSVFGFIDHNMVIGISMTIVFLLLTAGSLWWISKISKVSIK